MAATDTQVREALAAVIGKVDGLRAHPFVPGQINPPAAIVTEVNVDFDASMQRGSDEMTVLVRLLTGGDFRSAQQRLSELTYLIRDELWDDPTLGGVVADARLFRRRGDSEGQVDVGGGVFAVVDIEFQVVT
jgi:hypothetical protein